MYNRISFSESNPTITTSTIEINSNKFSFNFGILPFFNSEKKDVYADIRLSFTYNDYLSRAIKAGEKTLGIYIVPQYSEFFSFAICAASATRRNLAGYCYAISPSSGATENWYIHNILLPNTDFNIFHYWIHPSSYQPEAIEKTLQQTIEIKPYNYIMERVQ